MGEITGVKTEEVKIDSLKMWKSKKVKIKCEERLLKCEDCEAETPWYPPPIQPFVGCHLDKGSTLFISVVCCFLWPDI